MATGRGNYVTKQAGEYIVAAELSRRGCVATTFTGNVPSHDIVAVDDRGGHALVQVKAIAADSWQLTLSQFADVVFDGSKQIIRGQLADPYPNLICVMVQIAPANSARRDRFYVLPWRELARIVIDGHMLSRAGPERCRSFNTPGSRSAAAAPVRRPVPRTGLGSSRPP